MLHLKYWVSLPFRLKTQHRFTLPGHITTNMAAVIIEFLQKTIATHVLRTPASKGVLRKNRSSSLELEVPLGKKCPGLVLDVEE